MTENVVQFKKKKPVKQPRQTPGWLRRLMIILGIVAAFAGAYLYFSITGAQA